MALFLPFRNGERAIFTAGTVAQLNGPIFAKQALFTLGRPVPQLWRVPLWCQRYLIPTRTYVVHWFVPVIPTLIPTNQMFSISGLTGLSCTARSEGRFIAPV